LIKFTHKYSNFCPSKELFGENAGKKMRDTIIREYLSKNGEATNQNSMEIVKEGLIEILKRI